jgi:hypothetical protein
MNTLKSIFFIIFTLKNHITFAIENVTKQNQQNENHNQEIEFIAKLMISTYNVYREKKHSQDYEIYNFAIEEMKRISMSVNVEKHNRLAHLLEEKDYLLNYSAKSFFIIDGPENKKYHTL